MGKLTAGTEMGARVTRVPDQSTLRALVRRDAIRWWGLVVGLPLRDLCKHYGGSPDEIRTILNPPARTDDRGGIARRNRGAS